MGLRESMKNGLGSFAALCLYTVVACLRLSACIRQATRYILRLARQLTNGSRTQNVFLFLFGLFYIFFILFSYSPTVLKRWKIKCEQRQRTPESLFLWFLLLVIFFSFFLLLLTESFTLKFTNLCLNQFWSSFGLFSTMAWSVWSQKFTHTTSQQLWLKHAEINILNETCGGMDDAFATLQRPS